MRGDYLRSNFNYPNVWNNFVQGAIILVKGRFPSIFIMLLSLSDFVAASCCLLFRVGTYTAYQAAVHLSTNVFGYF